jgi:hypothetical protein
VSTYPFLGLEYFGSYLEVTGDGSSGGLRRKNLQGENFADLETCARPGAAMLIRHADSMLLTGQILDLLAWSLHKDQAEESWIPKEANKQNPTSALPLLDVATIVSTG